ncbi:ATP-binding cassette domain-containing protein [Alkalibaculum sp. M08DMB]|uniref:ATP-binding cassette domain-containing protein n=1 Tax=Alkalibaculum sporogenes TaxID=2655001 RepID=A0A6A7K546_9FIRM|nr:ABC transporter ATP-binding protein [Alkalibaculum sporogenes]MPW24263.1 ATP-binding cassette domain-containing protein [Alkalibaculum sporogenes]
MKVDNISFSYRQHKAVDQLSLKIVENEITTIIGANGCGKSTLFYLMTKNLKPDEGTIFLKEKNISAIHLKDFSKMVSIVHQQNKAPGDITVEKLVSYGRTPYIPLHRSKTKEDYSYIEWALDTTNLIDYKDELVSNLSGGQKQRVWIAMALAQNTKILFLDEPTTYLDIRYQIEILKLIQKLKEDYGMTIIIILHDINQSLYFSDQIIGMKKGKIVAQGNPDEIITSEVIEEIYDIHLDVMWWNKKKFVVTI